MYSDVAALVEKEREADAKAGNELAQVLEGHIKRKIIKQTVMTTVYGVTRFGARLQIDKQLKGVLEVFVLCQIIYTQPSILQTQCNNGFQI